MTTTTAMAIPTKPPCYKWHEDKPRVIVGSIMAYDMKKVWKNGYDNAIPDNFEKIGNYFFGPGHFHGQWEHDKQIFVLYVTKCQNRRTCDAHHRYPKNMESEWRYCARTERGWDVMQDFKKLPVLQYLIDAVKDQDVLSHPVTGEKKTFLRWPWGRKETTYPKELLGRFRPRSPLPAYHGQVCRDEMPVSNRPASPVSVASSQTMDSENE